MLSAGLVTGAQKGILYLRHEYQAQEKILHARRSSSAMRKACWARTFWDRALGFELELFISPGGYICGEEERA